jgi:hypothetical protein
MCLTVRMLKGFGYDDVPRFVYDVGACYLAHCIAWKRSCPDRLTASQ